MKKTIFVLIIMLTSMLMLCACDGTSPDGPPVPQYTVTFDSAGGSGVSSQSVFDGMFATEPAAPEREGYTLLGWYVGEEKWSFSESTVTEDVVLTAKWAVAKFRVTYELGYDGGERLEDEAVAYGELATRPVGEPHRSGYEFDGWYCGDRSWSFDEDTVKNNTVLTARWTKLHTVSFESEHGEALKAQVVRDGEIADKPDEPFAEGYLFEGWYNGDIAWSFNESLVHGDVTLVAKWKQDFASVGYDGSAVTIKFYHTMGSTMRAVLDSAIERFNELYPNITIVHEQIGSYDDVRDVICDGFADGSYPDIAYCYPDHVALYKQSGMVLPLDEFIASCIEITRGDGSTEIIGLTSEQISDFIYALYEGGGQYGDGQMYTLPFSKSTEVLYYNKTFFDMHGLSVPTTWNEMEEVCRIIKELDPDCIPLGYDSEANLFITMCAQLGSEYTSSSGEHFVFDNEANRGFVKMLAQWYEKGYITTQQICGSYTSLLFTGYSNTQCYMSIASSAGATYQRPESDMYGDYPFEVGIAVLPQYDPEDAKVLSQGPSLCMLKSDDPQKTAATWLFMKFLVTDSVMQASFSLVSGYTPVIKSAYELPEYAEYLRNADGGNNISALAILVALAQQEAYFEPMAFYGSDTARTAVGNLLVSCLQKYAWALEMGEVDAMIKDEFEAAVNECEYQVD